MHITYVIAIAQWLLSCCLWWNPKEPRNLINFKCQPPISSYLRISPLILCYSSLRLESKVFLGKKIRTYSWGLREVFPTSKVIWPQCLWKSILSFLEKPSYFKLHIMDKVQQRTDVVQWPLSCYSSYSWKLQVNQNLHDMWLSSLSPKFVSLCTHKYQPLLMLLILYVR